MTREQALEAALRLIIQAADEHRLTEGDCNEGRYALALPPDGVNADMLRAPQSIAAQFATKPPPFWASQEKALEMVRAAIDRATGKAG